MSFQKNLLSLIDELYFFNYELDFSDWVWRIIFLDQKKKWHDLIVRKYDKTYYLMHDVMYLDNLGRYKRRLIPQ